MGIYISKGKLESFRLTLLMLHDIYTNNDEIIKLKLKKYGDFNKDNNYLIEYAKITISYSLLENAITQMYHLFEQFIKVYFNIDLKADYFKEANKIAKKYGYDLEKNENFELVSKYRLLNNAIKHGGIEDLEKRYPQLINQTYDDNSYGTILDNKLNITSSEVDECCKCLYDYIDEMNIYFEDMGYIDNEREEK